MLDLDIEVRTTKIGMRRVFALKDFMPGDIVFAWDDDTTFTDAQYAALTGEQKAFVARFDGVWTFMPDPICYVQHAENANAGSRRGTVVAIKEIHAGEEIMINYERGAGAL